jgi:hypothetical protein
VADRSSARAPRRRYREPQGVAIGVVLLVAAGVAGWRGWDVVAFGVGLVGALGLAVELSRPKRPPVDLRPERRP